MRPKSIYQVCIDCGKRYGTKIKTVFGMWTAVCDICGEEKGCADAGHDFGIYNSKKDELIDRVQDAI